MVMLSLDIAAEKSLSNERECRMFRSVLCGYHLIDLHGIFRDRSCFVHAQYIDSCQRLNTFHIVYQDLLCCQTDDAYCQSDTCQQVQPLGNHSDNSSDHGGDAFTKRIVGNKELLSEQKHANGNNQNADHFDQTVQGADHFRLLALFHGFCFDGQL